MNSFTATTAAAASSIHSRQITSIYEAIEVGNAKLAINLSQKYLKKYPERIVYKALFALSLVRSGKIEEAERILNEFLGIPASNLDESIVIPLSTALKDIGKNEECAKLFERCFLQHPEREEYGVQYFLALCSAKEFQKQYQLSLKLFKSNGKKKFLFWSIASLFLQHRWDASESNSNGIFLKLAGKLCEKALEMQNGISTLEELQLIVGILEELCDFEAALKICIQHKDLFQVQSEFEAKQMELLCHCKRWNELFEMTFKFLSQLGQKDQFDWFYLSNFIESAKALQNEPEIKEKILSIQSNLALSSDTRAQLLGQIEFAKNFPYSPCSFEDCLWNYLETLGQKDTVLRDIHSMLQRSSSTQQEAFKNVLLTKRPESISHPLFIKCIHALRFCHHEIHVPIEILLQANTSESISLAVVQLLEEYDAFGKSSLLNSAFVLVWNLVQKEPLNFVFRIHLLVLAQQLGLFHLAFNIFESLNIKNIQLDSLCYLVAENATDLGHFDAAIQLFQRSFCLYYSNRNECSEAVSFCFRNGSFAKLIDFYSLSNTLENSLQWLLMEGEMLVIEPLLTVKKSQDLSKYYTLNESHGEKIVLSPKEIALMSDNRDLNVIEFEIGKRFKFVDEIFSRKGPNVAQAYSLFQLLLKKMESREIEGLKKVLESFNSLRLSSSKSSISYELLFDFVAHFFQDQIDCLGEFQKSDWKSLEQLKKKLVQFDWESAFSSLHTRIILCQFVIASSFSLLAFALLRDQKNVVIAQGITKAKELACFFVEKIKLFPLNSHQNENSFTLESCITLECSFEATMAYYSELSQEKRILSTSFVSLLNQKMALLK